MISEAFLDLVQIVADIVVLRVVVIERSSREVIDGLALHGKGRHEGSARTIGFTISTKFDMEKVLELT